VDQAASLSSSSSLELIFPAGREFEYLRDGNGQALGVIVREQEKLTVSIEMAAERCFDGVIRVTVRVSNLTLCETASRDTALMHSLVSAHTILGVENGEFVSLLDPPAELKDLSMECENTGTWPVLVDEKAETVLSSPIILYDRPQIAPESAGDLFDSTEIDEILSLRILTLTDEEKREMRQSDERARQILERTESMPPEQFMKLHGVLRTLTPLRGRVQ
jgi:hydrogenase maturation protease